MNRAITLITDFGPGSVYVGQMHAVLLRLAPDTTVVDLAHDCPPGDVEAAAYLLRRSCGHGPAGSVHVVVVDPGVGTDRAILAAGAHGCFFVGPDNGVLADAVRGGDVRRLENPDLVPEHVSSTFQGRDLMAPLAAWLATGGDLAAVGPPAEPERIPAGPALEGDVIAGRILIVDRFGNLITNIPRRLVEGLGGEAGAVRVRLGGGFIDGLVRTFADVPHGRALAYIGSGEHLEIAVNGGRASELFDLDVGAPVRVERGPR